MNMIIFNLEKIMYFKRGNVLILTCVGEKE